MLLTLAFDDIILLNNTLCHSAVDYWYTKIVYLYISYVLFQVPKRLDKCLIMLIS